MRETTFERVPVGAYFWRRGHANRYHKSAEDYASSFDDLAHPAEVPPPDKVVPLDPNWCPSCLAQMPWPPSEVCPFCRDRVPERRTTASIKAYGSQ